MKTTWFYLLAFGAGTVFDLLSGRLLGSTAIIFLVVVAGVIWMKKFLSTD